MTEDRWPKFDPNTDGWRAMEAVNSMQASLTNGELRTLLYIARWTAGMHRNHGTLSVAAMARGTGMAERSVRRVLPRLIKMGVIEVLSGPTAYKGRHIRIHLPGPPPPIDPGAEAASAASLRVAEAQAEYSGLREGPARLMIVRPEEIDDEDGESPDSESGEDQMFPDRESLENRRGVSGGTGNTGEERTGGPPLTTREQTTKRTTSTAAAGSTDPATLDPDGIDQTGGWLSHVMSDHWRRLGRNLGPKQRAKVMEALTDLLEQSQIDTAAFRSLVEDASTQLSMVNVRSPVAYFIAAMKGKVADYLDSNPVRIDQWDPSMSRYWHLYQ